MIMILQAYKMEALQESWRPPPRFQRKAWETRQCVAGSRFLQTAPEKAMFETEDPGLKLKTQEFTDTRNMECLLRKPAGSETSQPKTEAM
jgi:hypothetical protein